MTPSWWRPGPGIIPGLGAIVALALAGCGAGSPRGAPTRAEFVARADAICNQETIRLSGLRAREHASSASLMDSPRLIRRVAAIHEAATARLESLSQPTGETTTLARWLTARTVAATFELDTAEAPRDEGSVAASDIRSALRRAMARVRDLSESYGFRVCGASE
jgi:hypothetical protein